MDTKLSPSQLKELISTAEIHRRVKEIADEISRDYAQKELHLIGILKGAFIFLADLSRALTIPCHINFIHASSYGSGEKSSGQVYVSHNLNLHDKHVILVEDIVDTGLTLDRIRQDIQSQNPASLKICVLLDKSEARQVSVPIQYSGFTIPNHFVVGYGLDFNEHYRELPYIAYKE